MKKSVKINTWYILFAVMGVLMAHSFLSGIDPVRSMSYSEFQDFLAGDEIESIRITDTHIYGKLRSPNDGTSGRFSTVRVDPDLASQLEGRAVEFEGVFQSTWLRGLLSWVVPVVLFLGVYFFFVRRFIMRQGMGGGFMQIGKSRAKVYVENETKKTFDDVAGVDEAKEELQEIVDFLKSPGRYARLGAKLPKGALLVGPPGTGKTLLAKAVAGEAQVPFFSISGSEFVEMFVGVGAARVRDLFEQAAKSAPCIIFIDELDAMGRARGIGPMAGGHDEKEQTLNQLLVEMDGFESHNGMIILAATNRPEVLDPALLRAGRFDRQILVDRADLPGREAILKIHSAETQLAPDVQLEKVAALTPGFTGADLANLVNEATLLATRRDSESVSMEDFNAAIERIVAGLEKKNRLLNKTERRRVAFHELGHAFTAQALPGADPVHKVSIIPRGIGALGYTIQRPTEDRFLMSQRELENKIVVLLAGRAAEVLVFGDASTGAADDFAKATGIARAMVTKYGMRPELGLVSYDDPTPNMMGGPGAMAPRADYSEATAQRIDNAVREILDTAFDKGMAILELNKDVLHETAEVLLAKETLTEEDLPELRRLVEEKSAA